MNKQMLKSKPKTLFIYLSFSLYSREIGKRIFWGSNSEKAQHTLFMFLFPFWIWCWPAWLWEFQTQMERRFPAMMNDLGQITETISKKCETFQLWLIPEWTCRPERWEHRTQPHCLCHALCSFGVHVNLTLVELAQPKSQRPRQRKSNSFSGTWAGHLS